MLELAAEEGNVDIFRWIAYHATDVVDEYTDDNMIIYSASKMPLLMMFIEKDHPEFEPYLYLFASVALDYKD